MEKLIKPHIIAEWGEKMVRIAVKRMLLNKIMRVIALFAFLVDR
jgi:hypothetical protein